MERAASRWERGWRWYCECEEVQKFEDMERRKFGARKTRNPPIRILRVRRVYTVPHLSFVAVSLAWE
jgi:hypothetical protein